MKGDNSKDKGLLDFFCPVCGRNKFNRTNRNFFEKALYAISFGRKANKKFECRNCGWTVLIDSSKKPSQPINFNSTE
jgi:predicted RNA-binding Zn-ribbon protein involved in translation (DUF1610 family)